MSETVVFNPFEPGYVEDPTRSSQPSADDPVHQTPFGVWYVTRYDDVLKRCAIRR